MTDFVCGSSGDGALRILVKLAGCCIGATVGPDKCTCWEPIYDKAQFPAGTALTVEVWPTMCDDCAYRPDSPERQHDDRYVEPPDNGEPFWCHRGMRKVVGWRHPAGIVVDADGDYYAPPARRIEIAGERVAIPFQADGTPAKRCAGWHAHHARSSA